MQQCMELTGTNSSIGLNTLIKQCPFTGDFVVGNGLLKRPEQKIRQNYTAPLTWWLWRGGCTRSHSELGRETPQRRWYFVLRRGRVGRCQVCRAVWLSELKSFLFTPCFAASFSRAKQTQNRPRLTPGRFLFFGIRQQLHFDSGCASMSFLDTVAAANSDSDRFLAFDAQSYFLLTDFVC